MPDQRRKFLQSLFKQLQNAKFKEYYVELLLERYHKREQFIEVSLIAITCASTWAIWRLDYLDELWGGLVAISQIISLARIYLNGKDYVDELNQKIVYLRNLNIDYLTLWQDFNSSKIPFELASEKSQELQKDLLRSSNFKSKNVIYDDKKIIVKSKICVKSYLNTQLGITVI